jgi:hypothetical protein
MFGIVHNPFSIITIFSLLLSIFLRRCFMKKVFICTVLTICISTIVYSQDETQGVKIDICFSAGSGFGNYFMSGTNLENSYIGSPGVNLSFYALFGEKNIGLFYNYGILFSAVNDAGINYESPLQLDYILLGIGFGYDINETLKLRFGVGPNMNMLFLRSKENTVTTENNFLCWGLGGDIGLRIKLIKFISVDVGTTLSYNFAAYDAENIGWVDRFSMVGVKPYISFGGFSGKAVKKAKDRSRKV